MKSKTKFRTIHLLCTAHLDPVWLWPWEEGAAEAISTFRSAADLCEKNKTFVFNHNEAILYQWVQEYEPALFKRIQKLVKQGRWHIMGGWFLQPDCNMPSGESIVRQILVGREYFQRYFGVKPSTAINFDPFGHSRGLVQILAKSGFNSYIFGRPRQEDCPLPREEFVWEGFDGSTLLATRFGGWYMTPLGKAAEVIRERAAQMNDKNPCLILWGVGNHGGGPSRKDLRDIHQLMAKTKRENMVHSTPEAYFQQLIKQTSRLPRYRNDINPWATGCYSSQTRIKQKHRQLENEYFLTEKMASSAWQQGLLPYPQDDLALALNDLLTAEFHDILPGSSIEPVEEDALRRMDHGLEILSRLKARTFFALSSGQKKALEGQIPILVYNPHPFPVRRIVECEFQHADQGPFLGYSGIRIFQDGRELPAQVEKEFSNIPLDWRKRVAFQADLKPGQMSRFDGILLPHQKRPAVSPRKRGAQILFKTKDLEVRINTRTGLLDRYRIHDMDAVKPGACLPVILRDNADPWGMLQHGYGPVVGRFTLLSPARAARYAGGQTKRLASVRVIEDGSARCVVEALFGYGDSFLCQRYKLPKQGTEVEIEIIVHWNEKDRMLKLAIPLHGNIDSYRGQTMYGIQDLPRKGREAVAQKWTAALDKKRNLAVTCINEGLYSSDSADNQIRLTLLRSPAYSCHPWDNRIVLPEDRYVPRVDQGQRTFRLWLNAGKIAARMQSIDREALVHNEKPFALSFFPCGEGKLPKPAVVLRDAVVQITAMKKAQNGRDLIVRLFEPTGKKREAVLHLPMIGIKTKIALRGFEIKTLRINPKSKSVRQTDLLEK